VTLERAHISSILSIMGVTSLQGPNSPIRFIAGNAASNNSQQNQFQDTSQLYGTFHRVDSFCRFQHRTEQCLPY